MSTTAAATKPAETRPDIAQPSERAELPAISRERIAYHPSVQERFGIDRASWRALVEAIFPAAKSFEGVLLALSYCRARKLDPFKRIVHIVPVYDSEKRAYVETVWPGIAEHRTTAMRTGLYGGCDAAVFGEDVSQSFSGTIGRRGEEKQVTHQVTFPEWCQVTVYRMINGQRVPVPGPRVYWMETYATMGRSSIPNEMWRKRPRGQLEKCAEAAALRRAFPEELGSEPTADEMDGQTIDHQTTLETETTQRPDLVKPQNGATAEKPGKKPPAPKADPVEEEADHTDDQAGERPTAETKPATNGAGAKKPATSLFED